MGNFFVKAPGDLLDYKFDWSAWLQHGEVIIEAIITVPENIILDRQSNDNTSVTAWIGGGVVNTSHLVKCQITTNQGRINSRSINVYCQNS